DALLTAVAKRLSSNLRPSDTVARVGGDEFVVLREDIAGEREALDLVERLTAAFEQPFALGDREQHARASIGIAIWEAGTDAEALIRNADAAMYRAKERGRGGFELFDEALRDRSTTWLRTEAELRRALDRDELFNVYQPIVRAADAEIVGFEALVRWSHPERGT